MAAEAAESPRNPYPGLRPFRTDEKHLFFGRERQVDRMVERLAAHHFLAVVGGSGSGKSSLVNCGLRPALHRGNMTSAGATWRMAQMRPGSDPIGALARALASPGVLFDAPSSGALSNEELIETTLRMGSLGLVDIVEQADLAPGTQVLVVADQFEELFRFRGLVHGASDDAHSATEDAVAFVSLLLAAAAQTTVPIYVVLTMRSDFLGDCARFDGLPEAINEGQYLVPRLTRSEIRAVITGPASVAGGQISPVLVTQLLNDVGDNPDQLSILQHALNRTWDRWENEGKAQGPLDLPHYLLSGGMAGALDQHADKAFKELVVAERQRLAERVFKALTDKGTDARGTRRPTRFDDLCAITAAAPQDLLSVIDIFRKPSRSFLMPPDTEPVTEDSVIDISHESLMRVWKLLGRWADEEAQSARQYERLAGNAALYPKGADLLPQIDLDQALAWRQKQRPNAAWARQYDGNFVQAMDYLDASHAQSAAAEADRGRRWRVRAAVVGISLVAMVTVTLLGVAYAYQEEVSRRAKARDLLDDVALFADRAAFFAARDSMTRVDTAHFSPCERLGLRLTRSSEASERFGSGDTLHYPILSLLCRYQNQPTYGVHVDSFLKVIGLLNMGDLARADTTLRAVTDYDTRRAAESMIHAVLSLRTEDFVQERRQLLRLEQELKRDSAFRLEASQNYDESRNSHPVHRSIDRKLRQGKELSAGERSLLDYYKTQERSTSQRDAGANPHDTSTTGAQPADHEVKLYQPMINAAKLPDSTFVKILETVESYLAVLLFLLPWLAWKAWRWWQRRGARRIAASPSPIRLALASFFDILIACGAGFLAAIGAEQMTNVVDFGYGDWYGSDLIFLLALLFLALLVALSYLLLCDSILLRHRRSLGKVAFDLRPVHATGAVATAQRGQIGWRDSMRHNLRLVVSGFSILVLMMWLDDLYFSVPYVIADQWRFVLMAALAFGVVMWLPALLARRLGWHNRPRGLQVIDADSEESRRIDVPARYVDEAVAGVRSARVPTPDVRSAA